MFRWFDERVTPDLIPNSEVKPLSGDDTLMEGKVANRRNKVLDFKEKIKEHPRRVFSFFNIIISGDESRIIYFLLKKENFRGHDSLATLSPSLNSSKYSKFSSYGVESLPCGRFL